jgi:hypothetical protein
LPAADAITRTPGDTSTSAPNPAQEGSPDELEARLQRLAAEINHGHQQCELARFNARRHAHYVGERLKRVKDHLPHGQFERWLGQHCPNLRPRTARWYMWVYLNPERAQQQRTKRKRPARAAAATARTVSEPTSGQDGGVANGPATTADDRPDRSRRADDGGTLLEPIGPGPAGDDRPGEPDSQTSKPTTAGRFVRLCWDITDTASDTIRELGAGPDAQVVDRLRLLVPQAMRSLGEVAVALQIELPVAMDPTR